MTCCKGEHLLPAGNIGKFKKPPHRRWFFIIDSPLFSHYPLSYKHMTQNVDEPSSQRHNRTSRATLGYMSWADALAFAGLCALLQPWMPTLTLYTDTTPLLSYLTGHWVHLHWQHWLLNMLALLCLPLLMPCVSRMYFWFTSVLLSIIISLLLIHLGQLEHQRLISYVGFSGTLHGLYVLFALVTWVSQPSTYERIQASILLIGISIKVSYETLTSPTLSAEMLGAPVAHIAHLDGVIGGLLLFCFGCFLSAFYKKKAAT